MARIYLIRHGETEWNVTRRVMGRTDVPLDAAGEVQARTLAEVMRSLPVDGVFSSPQLRARQTAERVAEVHGLTVATDEALAEVDFPRWVGLTWEELLKDPVYDLYRRMPGSARHEAFEPLPDVLRRTSGFVEKLVRERPEGRFACVSHADPVRTILSWALEYPLNEMRRFRLSNASLTVLEKRTERWLLKLFNYRKELSLDSDV